MLLCLRRLQLIELHRGRKNFTESRLDSSCITNHAHTWSPYHIYSSKPVSCVSQYGIVNLDLITPKRHFRRPFEQVSRRSFFGLLPPHRHQGTHNNRHQPSTIIRQTSTTPSHTTKPLTSNHKSCANKPSVVPAVRHLPSPSPHHNADNTPHREEHLVGMWLPRTNGHGLDLRVSALHLRAQSRA